MKLGRIEYGNFKCFEKATFDMKKITLITGENSSGKSSFFYGFLGAIQSGEFPYRFSPNGKYVNMGDFCELSYLHNVEQEIKLSFEFSDSDDFNYKIESYWKQDKVRKIPTLSRLNIYNNYSEIIITKRQKYTLEFNYFEEKHKSEDLVSGEFALKLQSLIYDVLGKSKVENKENNSHKEKLEKNFKITERKIKDRRKHIKFTFENFTELDKLSFEKGNFILQQIIRNTLELFSQYEKKINFISSFRLYPERTYYEKSKNDLKIGKFGENYEDQIIAWETKEKKEYDELLSALQNLKLLDGIESRRIEGGRFEVLVRVKKNGVKASLNDVGFGISQFLPIVVADIQLGKNSTLFIAQPEIHLHPSIQASFGDYIVDNVKNKNKNYVVETHSEYVINRIRLKIVQNEISKEDVQVYYLSNNGKKAKVHLLEFTENGEIKNAPQEFFETYMIDVMDIANNLMK